MGVSYKENYACRRYSNYGIQLAQKEIETYVVQIFCKFFCLQAHIYHKLVILADVFIMSCYR